MGGPGEDEADGGCGGDGCEQTPAAMHPWQGFNCHRWMFERVMYTAYSDAEESDDAQLLKRSSSTGTSDSKPHPLHYPQPAV